MILNLVYREDLFHGLTRISSSTLNSLCSHFRFVSCMFIDGAYGGDVRFAKRHLLGESASGWEPNMHIGSAG